MFFSRLILAYGMQRGSTSGIFTTEVPYCSPYGMQSRLAEIFLNYVKPEKTPISIHRGQESGAHLSKGLSPLVPQLTRLSLILVILILLPAPLFSPGCLNFRDSRILCMLKKQTKLRKHSNLLLSCLAFPCTAAETQVCDFLFLQTSQGLLEALEQAAWFSTGLSAG